MESLQSFLIYLLFELPARAIDALYDAPLIAVIVVVLTAVVLLTMIKKQPRRKKRR